MMLKTIFAYTLILVVQLQLCFANESTNSQFDTKIKHHVSSNQIYLTEDGIFLNLGDVLLQAESLFHDDAGFYYLEEGMYWICRRCGALNDLDNSSCYRCGER